MKWAFVAAIVNAGVFLWWIVGFAGTLGTPHAFGYFWLPMAFLIVPLVIITVHRLTLRRPKNEELWGGLGCSALILNFILFVGYLMMAGGGV
jgi:hypothetical protein